MHAGIIQRFARAVHASGTHMGQVQDSSCRQGSFSGVAWSNTPCLVAICPSMHADACSSDPTSILVLPPAQLAEEAGEWMMEGASHGIASVDCFELFGFPEDAPNLTDTRPDNPGMSAATAVSLAGALSGCSSPPQACSVCISALQARCSIARQLHSADTLSMVKCRGSSLFVVQVCREVRPCAEANSRAAAASQELSANERARKTAEAACLLTPATGRWRCCWGFQDSRKGVA